MKSYAKLKKLSREYVGAVKATRIRTDAIEVSEVLRISRLRQVLDFLGQQTAIDLNREEVQQTV